MGVISGIGLLAAFAAGMISFLSPCVLPLVPGYISFISGNFSPAGRGRWQALGPSLSFVSGFSAIFIALGASATLISRLLLSYRHETNIIGGLIVIVFGIFATGLVTLRWLERDLRYHGALPTAGPLGGFALGLAFGFGWTPCIGPVLGAILTVSAVSTNTTAGVILLSAYSLGLGLPFVLSALFTDNLSRRLMSLRKTGRALKLGSGFVMIAMGVAMVTGYMTTFSYWLLETFPIFGRIG